MENVLGLQSAAGGEYFTRVQHEARLLNYRFVAQVADAFALGVPQKRRRQLFVEVSGDVPGFFPNELKPSPRAFPAPRQGRPLAICRLPSREQVMKAQATTSLADTLISHDGAKSPSGICMACSRSRFRQTFRCDLNRGETSRALRRAGLLGCRFSARCSQITQIYTDFRNANASSICEICVNLWILSACSGTITGCPSKEKPTACLARSYS
jgi:hypothetical protein